MLLYRDYIPVFLNNEAPVSLGFMWFSLRGLVFQGMELAVPLDFWNSRLWTWGHGDFVTRSLRRLHLEKQAIVPLK